MEDSNQLKSVSSFSTGTVGESAGEKLSGELRDRWGDGCLGDGSGDGCLGDGSGDGCLGGGLGGGLDENEGESDGESASGDVSSSLFVSAKF